MDRRICRLAQTTLVGLALSCGALTAIATPSMAAAECATYELEGEFWFSDRRVQTLSPAVWGTLGPAANVLVDLRIGGIWIIDIAPEQPRNHVCPAGVDCNAASFDDFEGATKIFVGLDGHWAMDVTLCLRRPHSDYDLALRPVFVYDTPRWRVVDADREVYAVAGPARRPSAPGAVVYGYTFVPFFTRAEKAMWVFQSMREEWNFISVDGGCTLERGFAGPCGIDLGEELTVFFPSDPSLVADACGCAFCHGCTWQGVRDIWIAAYASIATYHEYGHQVLHMALRDIEAPTPRGSFPWTNVHEAWANFTQYAVVGDDFTSTGEQTYCSLERGLEDFGRILVDLYDRHTDCARALLNIAACDCLVHGMGHLTFVLRQMSEHDLLEVRDVAILANQSVNEMLASSQSGGAVVREFLGWFSTKYVEKAGALWTIPSYSVLLFDILAMNCVSTP